MSRSAPSWVAFLLATLIACDGDDSVAPAVGGVRISATTRGGDLDIDGYSVVVDGGPGVFVATDGFSYLTGLAPGVHVAELNGVADNCVASPHTVHSFTVVAKDTASVAFEVLCVASGIAVTTSTSGLDLDGGYSIIVDGAIQPSSASANGTVEVTRLASGSHQVALGDVSPNCAVAPPAGRTVTVAKGEVTPISFTVTCGAASGSIRVSVSTTGEDLDANGYGVQVDGVWRHAVPNAGSTRVDQVAGGDHQVSLADVAGNCHAAGSAAQTVTVKVGGATRDTVEVSFAVSCTLTYRLAFERDGRITVASADGGQVTELGPGLHPAWSPDGKRIGYGCGTVCLVSTDGSGLVTLPSPTEVKGVAWRRDGARIANAWYNCDYYYYGCTTGLGSMAADGTDPEWFDLSDRFQLVANPSWSPDGGSIVFMCREQTLKAHLCSIHPDGTALQFLTAGEDDVDSPAWSPDGSSIAFSSTRFGVPEIFLLDPATGGVTRLSSATPGQSPAWSPDGLKLVFTQLKCAPDCVPVGLSTMNVDGTGLVRITTGPDLSAAWRQ